MIIVPPGLTRHSEFKLHEDLVPSLLDKGPEEQRSGTKTCHGDLNNGEQLWHWLRPGDIKA